MRFWNRQLRGQFLEQRWVTRKPLEQLGRTDLESVRQRVKRPECLRRTARQPQADALLEQAQQGDQYVTRRQHQSPITAFGSKACKFSSGTVSSGNRRAWRTVAPFETFSASHCAWSTVTMPITSSTHSNQ